MVYIESLAWLAPSTMIERIEMQKVAIRRSYTANQISKIEAMGPLSVTVANRWIMGWPERVAALFAAGTYFDCLTSQVEREKDVLADEAGLRHLARHEILQLHEIREAPPW